MLNTVENNNDTSFSFFSLDQQYYHVIIISTVTVLSFFSVFFCIFLYFSVFFCIFLWDSGVGNILRPEANKTRRSLGPMVCPQTWRGATVESLRDTLSSKARLPDFPGSSAQNRDSNRFQWIPMDFNGFCCSSRSCLSVCGKHMLLMLKMTFQYISTFHEILSEVSKATGSFTIDNQRGRIPMRKEGYSWCRRCLGELLGIGQMLRVGLKLIQFPATRAIK